MFFEFLRFIFSKLTFFTGAITGNSFPKPLSVEEEKQAIELLKLGDKSAKDKLITHNMRLVAHMVKKYSGSAETDDLISVGSIGLIKAVNTYEPQKGALATFAARCIENEILMLLRSNKKHKNDVYLSDTVGADKDGNELNLLDLLYEKDDVVLEKVDKGIEQEKFLKFIKKVLSKREFTVLTLRYGLNGGKNYAQREVAVLLKISRSYVSRIETKAIEKLKDALNKEHFYC